KKTIEINLKEGKAIRGIKFISRPSRRMYAGYKGIRSVKSGHGTGVVSTSKGIMSDHDARKNKLGGQLLFQIW
ncbi:MAG: 30S ribosomal protein S8, partial [Candidatus Paceibacterota bacterium]